MNESNLPEHSRHHVPLQQQLLPSTAGPSAPRGSLPFQHHLLSQGLQQKLLRLEQVRQQTQPTTFSSSTTGLPFTVAPDISTTATSSAKNSQKALGVFGNTMFEEHARRSASIEPPMHNRDTAEYSFSYPPFLGPASPQDGARLKALTLQSLDQLKNQASIAGKLHSPDAPNVATLKRSRDVIMQENSGSAPWERTRGAEKSTPSPTTTTTTTDGLGSRADATRHDDESVKKKRRIAMPASLDTQTPFASLSGEFNKMQSIMERYTSATEIAQIRLSHDFLEDKEIQDYGNEFKKECVGLVRFCLRNNYLSVCERIISESEKFFAETFPPAFNAGERARWRLSDELASHDLNNLCALLDRSNLIKLLCQRDEFRQQASGNSLLPHESPRLATVVPPTIPGEVFYVPPAPERLTSSEPVAAADTAPHMAIILESPADAGAFVKDFVELIDTPSRISQTNIDEFISEKRNFQTVETTGEFLRTIFKLLSAIRTQRNFSKKFDEESILRSALEKLFAQMRDKQASKEKIAITNRVLVELAIDKAELCVLIHRVLLDMAPKSYNGIVYKADFEIISGLHETGVPNFQAGDELQTNSIIKNLRDGEKFSKGQVISYLKTALAGSSTNSLSDYFQTLEFLLEELLLDSEKYQDLTAQDIISASLDRVMKTSNASTLHDIASQYLLRLAIRNKHTCDILARAFSHMSDEKKRKFRVVRKMEFFSRAHALLKAKFYIPAPSRHKAGIEPGVISGTPTGRQDANKSARKKSTARTEVGPTTHAYGRTDSRTSTIGKPIPSNSANSSSTSSSVLAGETAGGADRKDEGTKSSSSLEDESEN